MRRDIYTWLVRIRGVEWGGYLRELDFISPSHHLRYEVYETYGRSREKQAD